MTASNIDQFSNIVHSGSRAVDGKSEAGQRA